MRAAIVTTLRAAGPALASYIRYHLGLGFEHLFLFFDDPGDPGIALARSHPAARVTPVIAGAALEAEWRRCAQHAHFAPHVAREVMARQCLNAEVAARMGLARGLDWLLHIDADELFSCPGQDAPGHFARLAALGIDRAVYPNLEALAESADVTDCFREVTLFKVNRNTLPGGRFSAEQAALAAQHPQFGTHFFQFYSNGKSAARLAPGLVPDGVHRFHARLLPQPHHPRVVPARAASERVIGDCRILHYACCGYRAWSEKYRILGRFDDRWFGTVSIRDAIGDFHLASRDVVAGGDAERMRAFYRERAMLDDPAAIERLIGAGLLVRVREPADWLDGRGSRPS